MITVDNNMNNQSSISVHVTTASSWFVHVFPNFYDYYTHVSQVEPQFGWCYMYENGNITFRMYKIWTDENVISEILIDQANGVN